jgi:hypothetical protein
MKGDKEMKQVRIRDIYDVCDALNELDQGINTNTKKIKGTKKGIGLVFLAGLIFGAYTEMRIRNMELRMNDQFENQKLQDQLDSQEQKILQLEIELDELKELKSKE